MTEQKNRSVLTKWLESAPSTIFVFYAIFFAFTTYFTMYAFRKPFAAAMYSGYEFGGFTLKAALVISQILGYAISKYIGIKVCSEIIRDNRLYALFILIISAEVSLILFAIVPIHWKVFAIFLNGLPLGMVWGLVVLYLEGRRTSELLLAGLSCSFIVASGVVKDVGRTLMMNLQISEWWMPAVTGLCFLPFFLLAAWLLDQVPSASQVDIAEFSSRAYSAGHHIFLSHGLQGLSRQLWNRDIQFPWLWRGFGYFYKNRNDRRFRCDLLFDVAQSHSQQSLRPYRGFYINDTWSGIDGGEHGPLRS